MSALDWLILILLVGSSVAIVIELGIAAVWAARLARRARLLNERLAAEQRLVESDLARLRAALAETAELWKPYQRALRLLQHPLVVALVQSYVRRRAAAR